MSRRDNFLVSDFKESRYAMGSGRAPARLINWFGPKRAPTSVPRKYHCQCDARAECAVAMASSPRSRAQPHAFTDSCDIRVHSHTVQEISRLENSEQLSKLTKPTRWSNGMMTVVRDFTNRG